VGLCQSRLRLHFTALNDHVESKLLPAAAAAYVS
jgi:hypothetical protein